MKLYLTEHTKSKMLEAYSMEFDSIGMELVSIRESSVVVNIRVRLGNICVAERLCTLLEIDQTLNLQMDGPHRMEIELE